MADYMAADLETASAVWAELQAMAATPLDGVRGVSGIDTPSLTAEPLTVMKAIAESDRAVAAALAARAGFLPGLSVGAASAPKARTSG